jgi:hypothetical protein
MKRRHWIELGPALVLAFGIIASTILMVASDSAWLVGAGSLLFALSIVGADILGARLRDESPVPSPTSLVVAAVFLVACGIIALRDPALVKLFILTGGSVTVILPRFSGRSLLCGDRTTRLRS